MSKESLLVQLRPQAGLLHGERRWSDAEVKKMLFAFARDLGCKWRKSHLERVIDQAFGEGESKCMTVSMNKE